MAGALIALVALASALAIAWPSLPFDGPGTTGPSRVGIITKDVAASGEGATAGSAAPDFEWLSADATTRSLRSLRGRVVVINFWATWCVPCREEMPALERAARGAASDVEFLAVDLQENGERVRSFFDQLALDHLQPILDVSGSTAKRYVVLSLPTTYFIGADGVIRHVELGGPMSDQTIAKYIAEAKTAR